MRLSILTAVFTALTLSLSLRAKADKLMILDSVQDTMQARVDLIKEAKHTIDVQYFTVEHDTLSVAGLALIKEAARRGVNIRIIVDSMHNLMTRELMSAFLDNLKPAALKNIEIREFNQFNLFRPFCYTRRMHDKALIIDNEYLIVGDRNVGNGYYNGDKIKDGKANIIGETRGLPIYQGVDALIQGSTAASLATKYFSARWDSNAVKPVRLYEYSQDALSAGYCFLKAGEGSNSDCDQRQSFNISVVKSEMIRLEKALTSINNEKLVKLNQAKTWFNEAIDIDAVEYLHDKVGEKKLCDGKDETDNIGSRLYKAIEENTTNDVIIMTPYLVATPEMENLVKTLVTKGIQVRFVTNSKASNDVPSAHAGYLKTRQKLLDQGATIYEYEKLDSALNTIHTLHAKVVLIDTNGSAEKSKIFIGSYNWDPRSQNLNSEVGILATVRGKKDVPTLQVRKRMADILRSTTWITKDNASDKIIATKYSDDVDINKMLDERSKAVDSWTGLLNNKLFGQFLEGQL
ncbi:MAG: phosphatidylserine/phosphatidylglycerophosphate/cardiolipin synthase family protein [Bdellovibrio sp.]|nr:phosphatidylserine/phosphatidylglycerophosphate/cardiolipin synthase family protein [Bdellovibrio sp.]